MHEVSLARRIVAMVLQAQKQQKAAEITEVKVMLGELEGVDPQFFEKLMRTCVEEHAEHLAKTKFLVEVEKPKVICTNCKKECIPEVSKEHDHHDEPKYQCQTCGSNELEVKQGKGAYIAYVKGKNRRVQK